MNNVLSNEVGEVVPVIFWKETRGLGYTRKHERM